MKSITANWFITKIRYDQTRETGIQKKTTEQYVIDSLSFGEAEKHICEEMAPYVEGEFEVLDISRAPFKEVFFSDDSTADKWYKIRLSFITIDEKTMNEKQTAMTYLVQGADIETARKNTEEVMRGSMVDYVITAVNETKILDVFMYCISDK